MGWLDKLVRVILAAVTSVVASDAYADAYADFSENGNLFVYLLTTADRVVLCSADIQPCIEGDESSTGVFVFHQPPELDWPELLHLSVYHEGTTSFEVIDTRAQIEISRGTYVVIGAVIAAVSAYGLRVIELAGASIFRRRRAIARLRANLLEVRELFSSDKSVVTAELTKGLTSFGKVYLQKDIKRINALSNRVSIGGITMAEISKELDSIDRSIARKKVLLVI